MRMFTRVLGGAIALVLMCESLGVTQLSPTRAVTVTVDGQVQRVTSTAPTVSELLIELGVTLGDRDRTSPPLKTAVTDGLAVTVTRVTRREVVEQVTVPAKAHVLAAPGYPAGYTKLLSKGQDGLVKRVVEVWGKDGQVSQRNVLRERVLVRMKPKIVLQGTLGDVNRGGGYHQPFRMVATGYAGGACGGSASGHTASGLKARRGVVAVDTRFIPLGTRLYVPGYGFAVAADRGSAIRGNRIDLCFDTYGEAIRFGRRSVQVYILR